MCEPGDNAPGEKKFLFKGELDPEAKGYAAGGTEPVWGWTGQWIVSRLPGRNIRGRRRQRREN